MRTDIVKNAGLVSFVYKGKHRLLIDREGGYGHQLLADWQTVGKGIER